MQERAARAGRVLLPFAARKNGPSAAALTIPGFGWGLPGSGGPTGHHRGFPDRRPRTHRRRRPGRLQGRFTPVADHAAHRSRRHDPLAPLLQTLVRPQRRASGIGREPTVSMPTRSEAGSCSQRVRAAPLSTRDPTSRANPRHQSYAMVLLSAAPRCRRPLYWPCRATSLWTFSGGIPL